MHHDRLDQLTRFLGHLLPRRAIGVGLLGGLLTGILPATPDEMAAAPKRKRSCPKPKRRCGKTCVNVKSNRQHCGKCNRTCTPGTTCRQGRCVPPSCGQGGPCRAFVTSVERPGNLGGLAGADAFCTLLARQVGLPGTYMAWLSANEGSPATRFMRNPRPYVRVDGVPIAASWTALTTGELINRLNVTERGELIAPGLATGFIWTATSSAGAWAGPDTCNDWTSDSPGTTGVIGDTAWTQPFWSNIDQADQCSRPHRFVCFQQS